MSYVSKKEINFLDEVRKLLTSLDNSEMKSELIAELTSFFREEINNSASIANLTMVLNMMEAFTADNSFGLDESYTKELDSLIDQIEEDYENVLVAAEDSIEENQRRCRNFKSFNCSRN